MAKENKKGKIRIDWDEAPTLIFFLLEILMIAVMIIIAVVGIIRWTDGLAGISMTVIGVVFAVVLSLLLPTSYKLMKENFFYRD